MYQPLSAWSSKVGALPPDPGGPSDLAHTFFIDPTTFRCLGEGWNAPRDDSDIAENTDTWP